jgi:hypothetical protein
MVPFNGRQTLLFSIIDRLRTINMNLGPLVIDVVYEGFSKVFEALSFPKVM